jgi:hypothetical protein
LNGRLIYKDELKRMLGEANISYYPGIFLEELREKMKPGCMTTWMRPEPVTTPVI